jgi:hypothetical protein
VKQRGEMIDGSSVVVGALGASSLITVREGMAKHVSGNVGVYKASIG